MKEEKIKFSVYKTGVLQAEYIEIDELIKSLEDFKKLGAKYITKDFEPFSEFQ